MDGGCRAVRQSKSMEAGIWGEGGVQMDRRLAGRWSVLVAGVVCAAVTALATSAANAAPSITVPCSGPGGGAAGLVAAVNAANTAGGGSINLAAGCTYSLTTRNNV